MAHMAKRLTINLPDTVHADLERWSELRGQALASVAAIAIELAVNAAKDKGELPPPTEETQKKMKLP